MRAEVREGFGSEMGADGGDGRRDGLQAVL